MSNRMSSEQISQFIGKISKNPDQEIPESLFHTLDSYNQLISSLHHEEIGSRYRFIMSDLVSLLQEPNLSSEIPLSDRLSQAFLNFILEPPIKASQWAMQQLKKPIREDIVAIPELVLSKNHCISAIYQYPEKYFSFQTDESLYLLSNLHLPSKIAQALVSELIHRGIPINPELIGFINLQSAPAEVILVAFDIFLDSPTLDMAKKMMSAFYLNPPLHLVCINKIVKNIKEKSKHAAEMLGTIISQTNPYPFPLFLFYHPSVKPFIDEAEIILLNPDDSIENDLIIKAIQMIGKKNLYFLIPILLALPFLAELIHSIGEEYFICIEQYLIPIDSPEN